VLAVPSDAWGRGQVVTTGDGGGGDCGGKTGVSALSAIRLLVSVLLIGVYLVHNGISAVYARGTQPNDMRCTAKMHEVHSGI
jgi:hypothetical protein